MIRLRRLFPPSPPRLPDLLKFFLPPVLGLLQYGKTLTASDFIRDDALIIAENPLLRSASGFLGLWSSGYWEAVSGTAARVAEYRPLTMSSFFLDARLFGFSPGPMHAMNLLIHGLNCLLIRRLLQPRLGDARAWVASVLFAVLPIHAEAVAGLVGRSELLAAFFILSAWCFFQENRRNAAAAAFAAGLLCKEHVILLPLLLAVDDRGRNGFFPWGKTRIPFYALFSVVAGTYLAARASILPDQFSGGADYFAATEAPERLLTTAKFWVQSYLWPALSGRGLSNDFSRPLIQDSQIHDWKAWICLMTLSGSAAAATAVLARRRAQWPIWILLPFIFLLPTSHLVFPLDSLGAQRFFYLPSLSLCAALAVLLTRANSKLKSPLVAGTVLFYFLWGSQAAGLWTSDLSYYSDVALKNPVSSGGRVGLAFALLKRGRTAEAELQLREALRLEPALWSAHYNLGKIAWERGDSAEAERLFLTALRFEPRAPGVLSHLALAAELKFEFALAEKLYLEALAIQPRDPVSRFNLGILYWKLGKRRHASEELGRFLKDHPNDPDSPAARELLN